MSMLGANLLSMSALSLYRNAVQFGMSIAVAAFVSPADYGLVTFTLPFLTFAALLTDMGLSASIVRAPDIDGRQIGAAFSFTLALGIAFAGVLFAAAAPIAHGIGMTGLPPVMRAMAVVIALTMTAAVPRACLERRLRYGRIALVEAGAVLGGAIVGLSAAWHGAGVWALVLYNLVNHGLRAGALLLSAGGEIRPNLHWRGIAALLGFGGWVMATNLLNFVARNGDNLLIGALLGSAAVGVYGLAYQFMLVPLMAMTWPASGILLATLRAHRDDPEQARRHIETVMAATAMLAFPAMAFLSFGLGFPASRLLSPRWAEVLSLVRWLAPVGAVQAISSYNGAVLLYAGKARLQFAGTVVNTAVLLATFAFALPFGLQAFVRVFAIVSLLLSFGFLELVMRLTSLTWRRLAHGLLPALLATAAGLAAAALAGVPASWPQWCALVAAYGLAVLGTYALLRKSLRGRLHLLVARPA